MSVTAVEGFVAAGIHCGVKASGERDLAVVATAAGRPVAAAGVFTRNRMTAAPVIVSRRNLEATGGHAAAVVLNSGCANAATGEPGLADAETMGRITAAEVGCAADEVLVCSTGLIGYRLPMAAIESGIPTAVAVASPDGGGDAADAIRTTDTVPRQTVATGAGFTVGAMAKGAAMLEPNMATMLAVLTTDAEAGPDELRGALRSAVASSFNRLTVDGAESTNDTVLVLATGRAGRAGEAELTDAFATACRDLAMQMADDAEGSTKTVIIRVEGAADDLQALHAARAVANNQLAKCSWYGKNAYWGRVASEVGASGIEFDPEAFSITYGGTVAAASGVAVAFDEAKMAEYFENRRIHITIDLALGTGVGEIVTTDLSHGYVDENMGKS